jgi:ketose-bisphosphate aldolase
VTLVTLNEVLPLERKNCSALGAFMVWSFDSIFSVVDSAQKMGRPALMVVGDFEARKYMGGFRMVREMVDCVAKDYDIPVILHADHFRSFDSISESIESGFSSVMVDASWRSFEENVAETKRVVEYAHKYNVSVEGELGRLPGNEGDEEVTNDEAFQTDPEEADIFVKTTGIDALAVSIGTMHGKYTFEPKINIGRLCEIAKRVSIPLVLHGGSGTPEDKIIDAIHNGIAKINIGTDLLSVTAQTIATQQKIPDFRYSVGSLFLPARDALQRNLEYKMELFMAKR